MIAPVRRSIPSLHSSIKHPLFITHCIWLYLYIVGQGDMMIAPVRSSIPSLHSCIKHPLFITHCIWLCLLQLRFYYFIGALNTYLNRILDRDEELGITHEHQWQKTCLPTRPRGYKNFFMLIATEHEITVDSEICARPLFREFLISELFAIS